MRAESREICRHIAEKYVDRGNKDLLPAGTLERASIEQWLQTEECSFDPPSSALIFNLAFRPMLGEDPDEKEVAESEKKLKTVLNIYERRLQESEYLAGDKFSLADLSHLPNGHRLVNNAGRRSFFESRPKVNQWWQKISSRPAWQKVVEMQVSPPQMI